MATARFKIGTAATNTAGTSWSWRAVDAPADIASGSYVKCALESTTGVGSVSYTIYSADSVSIAAGLPTVTTVQATKTATFQAGTGAARTYLVKCQINSGQASRGDNVTDYEKRLAAHILTVSGRRLFAVGEIDEASRSYGYEPKLNALANATAASVVSGTTSPTFQIDSTADGPILRSSGGALSVRNELDTAYESVLAKTVELSEASAIEMRVGATGRGDGLTVVHQATGTDIWYGWVESRSAFGVSEDAGSTWTDLGSSPPAANSATLSGSYALTSSTTTITGVTITPATGSYLVCAHAQFAISAGVVAQISVAGVAATGTEMSFANGGEFLLTQWFYSASAIVTVNGAQAITLQASRDADPATATASVAGLSIVKVTPP
jgi:hypothetical protein